jgi:hypothetical protein
LVRHEAGLLQASTPGALRLATDAALMKIAGAYHIDCHHGVNGVWIPEVAARGRYLVRHEAGLLQASTPGALRLATDAALMNIAGAHHIDCNHGEK